MHLVVCLNLELREWEMAAYRKFYFEKLGILKGRFNRLPEIRDKAIEYELALIASHCRSDLLAPKTYAMLISYVEKL